MSLRPRNLTFYVLEHLPAELIEAVYARSTLETDQLKMS
jgi:hypothetical protein